MEDEQEEVVVYGDGEQTHESGFVDKDQFKLSVFENNIQVYDVENQLFVFVDSEFEEDSIICLQVVLHFVINGERTTHIYTVFNEVHKEYLESKYPNGKYTYKGMGCEAKRIFYSFFTEQTNVLLETLI